MTTTRLSEETINASLDACLYGAQKGDTAQAKRLHEMLDLMLTERESSEGRMWLTDHGREVLADMHRQLSKCEGNGTRIQDVVLEAVQLKPHMHHWDDTCSYLHDLRVALTVANELCTQRDEGKEPDLSQAAKAVAESGEFGMEPAPIINVYEKIASSVSGFRNIPGC